MMVFGTWLALPLVLLAQAPATDAPKPAPKAEAPKTADLDPKNPEGALRLFMITMLDQDEAKLRTLTLPDPDFAILLKSSGGPPTALQKALARTMFTRTPIRTLKVGDVVEIPARGGKRELTVGPDDVSETAAFLQMEGNPLPTRLRKVEGTWRVDAAPIIAGRKAAAAFEAERKAQKQQPKP